MGHLCQASGGPESVLAYLSRYTHRIAISNRRLVAWDDTGVTFKWKDYRIDGHPARTAATVPLISQPRRWRLRRSNPHSASRTLTVPSRDFLHWPFAYAGRWCARRRLHGRHPQTFTDPDSCTAPYRSTRRSIPAGRLDHLAL